ncbi:MAG: phage integrase N-terminal SAM-like domain-containing protein [Thermoplasmata archaeon]
MELAERSKPLRAHESLDDHSASFIEDCRLRGMTHYSIHSYASALRSFYRHLGGLGIQDVTSIDKDAVRDYVRVLREERKLSISTIENHLSCISAFFDYLIYEDVIDTNIALSVRKRYVRRYKAETPDEGHTRKLITVEQLRALVESILAVTYVLLTIAYLDAYHRSHARAPKSPSTPLAPSALKFLQEV